ncbi:WAT1-related protein At3g28130 isoform X1 [Helianthus annuus]|uniref:WAT1-related protein At3g28130 isoform X1 n=1 Tax=Helianthus annuus TaxID=4232 RepID=UPI000B8F902E|nr:WAT1-related protein At3g28130 isoform X1 [Helianthus annuus]
MTRRRWSWMNELLPFVAMLMTTCLDMGALTLVKAAMDGGLSIIVYIVYHSALGTFILLPFFIIHIYRNIGRPQLTFHIMLRFFILGLLGLCLYQILGYVGVYYSSPTMASALGNLTPAITFVTSIIFRMEKIDMRSSVSVAKLSGTIITICGAMVFTFYQGPQLFVTIRSPGSPDDQILLSQPSNWVFGGLMIFIGGTFGCIWNVLQSAIAKEFPDQFTIVFFFCLFGTIQCTALSPFLEPNPSAWLVQSGIGTIAVVFGAVYSVGIRISILTWCLEKKGPVYVAMFSPLSIVIAIIMGVTFLGDALHIGSAIGAVIIIAGFYVVMWGQVQEKNKLEDKHLDVANESGLSDQTAPLLFP